MSNTPNQPEPGAEAVEAVAAVVAAERALWDEYGETSWHEEPVEVTRCVVTLHDAVQALRLRVNPASITAALTRARQEGAEEMRVACEDAIRRQIDGLRRDLASAKEQSASLALIANVEDCIQTAEASMATLGGCAAPQSPTPPPAAQAQPKSCDYYEEKVVSDKQHGPAKHRRGGYDICQNCYDATMEAERRWFEANSPAAQPQPPAGDEREAFEALAPTILPGLSLYRDASGRYDNPFIRGAWIAWQARAAQAKGPKGGA